MKLRNLAQTTQTIDAADGMRVIAGEVSGNLPKAVADSLLKNQPETWAVEVKKTKPAKAKGGK